MNQLTIFDFLAPGEMYDGYIVSVSGSVLISGGKWKLRKGEQYYFVYGSEKTGFHLERPNEHGGAIGTLFTKNQFEKHFSYLGRKVYPKRKDIWNGKGWIDNPAYRDRNRSEVIVDNFAGA
ncbi:MAG TPA: hypothetical protein VIG80_04420 [Bacillaceae bacterium]